MAENVFVVAMRLHPWLMPSRRAWKTVFWNTLDLLSATWLTILQQGSRCVTPGWLAYSPGSYVSATGLEHRHVLRADMHTVQQ